MSIKEVPLYKHPNCRDVAVSVRKEAFIPKGYVQIVWWNVHSYEAGHGVPWCICIENIITEEKFKEFKPYAVGSWLSKPGDKK